MDADDDDDDAGEQLIDYHQSTPFCQSAARLVCLLLCVCCDCKPRRSAAHRRQHTALADMCFALRQKQTRITEQCTHEQRLQRAIYQQMLEQYAQLLRESDQKVPRIDPELVYSTLRQSAADHARSAHLHRLHNDALVMITRCHDQAEALHTRLVYGNVLVTGEQCAPLEQSLNQLESQHQCLAITCQVSKQLMDLGLVERLHNSHRGLDCQDPLFEYEPSDDRVRVVISDLVHSLLLKPH